MPDPTTITALTALAAIVDNDDVLAVDDTSAGATKSVLAKFVRGFKVNSVTATGSLTPNTLQLVTLSSASAIALTLSGSPTAGDVLFVFRKGTGGVTHTIVLGSGIDFDASGNGTANFDADNDCLIAVAESATRWITFIATGVTFSA